MIRKENLEDMLKAIGYIRDAHKKIYEKRYAAFDCVIEVDFTGRKMGFSRAYRASIDRVQGITFSVPDRGLQDKTISKIMQIEEQIGEAEEKLEVLKGKTFEIVRSFL